MQQLSQLLSVFIIFCVVLKSQRLGVKQHLMEQLPQHLAFSNLVPRAVVETRIMKPGQVGYLQGLHVSQG